MLDMAGLEAERLDWGGLGGDDKGDGRLGLGGLRPRLIGIGKAGLETGVWGSKTGDNTGDMGTGSWV